MKLLFVHDGTLKYDENGNFYGTAVTPNSLSRYKYMSDNITVLIRTKQFEQGESRERYTMIPSEYKIEHVDNYMTIKGMLITRNKVKRMLERLINDVDIVVCRFSGETGKIAAEICHRNNKPYIIECVGCAWDSYWNYGIKGKLVALYMFLHQKILIKRAPYVIYVTEKFLQKRYPTNGKWIAASNVELKPMDYCCLKYRLNKIRNKDNNTPIILGTAAAIDVLYKGQAYVLEAMSILKKEGLKFKYQVIGSGKPDYLVKMAKKFGVYDDFEIIGTLPHEKVFDWIDNLDIYIQPSNQEGLPRALIEAMSRACPAIGSSTAGIPELLDNRAIFKRKKVLELADVLRYFNNKDVQITQASHNFVTAERYQKEKIYKRRNEFFKKVLEENKLRYF